MNMKLRAGFLTMSYEQGFLRDINYNDIPFINMIYFNIRTKNWDTIPMSMVVEDIVQEVDCFSISYEAVSKKGEIEMYWKITITGSAKGFLNFRVSGKALSTFKRNRVGLCVLHPVPGNQSRKFLVEQTNGIHADHRFPRFISPQIICTDIRSITWNIDESVSANITCLGDAFEMEDHRNWADYSFKTYCTPLSRPFPVEVRKDEEIQQTVMVSLQNASYKKTNPSKEVNILVGSRKFNMPFIGVGRTSHSEKLNDKILKEIKKIGFCHYRTELYPGIGNWQSDLLLAATEAKTLHTGLEIFLFLSADFTSEIEEFLKIGIGEKEIKQIAILPRNECIAINPMLEKAVPLLKNRYPSVPLGSGTTSHFAELNRSDLNPVLLDFVTYSANPQVHATDNKTIIENLPALGETIISAKQKFPSRKTHVSPLIFINPDKKGKINDSVVWIDPRLKTSFGAGWLVGSLQSIVLSGADSVTCLETLGENGLFETVTEPKTKKNPLIKVFKEVLKWKFLFPVSCHQPNVISCLVFKKAKKTLYILANHTDCRQKVCIRNDSTNKILIRKTLFPYQVRFLYC